MPEIVLRQTTCDDLDRVMEIEYASFPSPWPREDMEYEITQNHAARYYVLEADGMKIQVEKVENQAFSMQKKKLILVAAPPACGKNYVSERIAEECGHIVYLDKDDLCDLVSCAFDLCGKEHNMDSKFYSENIRL